MQKYYCMHETYIIMRPRILYQYQKNLKTISIQDTKIQNWKNYVNLDILTKNGIPKQLLQERKYSTKDK